MLGDCLAQLVNRLDSLVASFSTRYPPISGIHFLTRLSPQLLRCIYLLASDSYGRPVTKQALEELGYSMDLASLTKPWPLTPGPRVFCLFTCHILTQLRPLQLEESGTLDAIKTFWTTFRRSIKLSLASCVSSSLSRDASANDHDVSPQLLQFAFYLASKATGLSAKKVLLHQLTECVCHVFDALTKSVPTDQTLSIPPYRLALRVLIMLRYVLPYFYVPSRQIANQVKPSLLLRPAAPSASPSSSSSTNVDGDDHGATAAAPLFQYTRLTQLTGAMHTAFRLDDKGEQGVPLFYDLLTPVISGDDYPASLHHLPPPEDLVSPFVVSVSPRVASSVALRTHTRRILHAVAQRRNSARCVYVC